MADLGAFEPLAERLRRSDGDTGSQRSTLPFVGGSASPLRLSRLAEKGKQMTREKDYAYEALAEVTGTDMAAGRGELNAALKSIKEQSETDDSYLLADEIQARAKLYRQVMPDVMLTPSALAKHWLRVFEEANRKPAVASNQNAAATRCATCSGDRFVLVARRPAVPSQWMKEQGIKIPDSEGFEEYAVCPDCNVTDSSFRRHDGSLAAALDSARVRELMSR